MSKSNKKTTVKSSSKSSKSNAKAAPKSVTFKNVEAKATKKAGEFAVTVDNAPAGFATFDAMTGWTATGRAAQLLENSDTFEAALTAATKKGAVDVTPKVVRPIVINDTSKPAAKATKKPSKKTDAKAAKKSKDGTSKRGIGDRVKALLGEGKSTDDVLSIILKEFPGAKTTRANVAWYKWQMNAS